MNEQWIPLSVPDLTDTEAAAVAGAVDIVHDGRVSLSAIPAFESAIAELTGREQAVALSSGTAALHLGLIHLGARRGKLVLTSSMTFAATANAIRYTGAEPIFIDSLLEDANVDAELMLVAADELTGAGHEVVAAVPVDLYGRCVDYTTLVPGLAERGIPLFCDAAESLGAAHHGRPAGSFGVAGAVSFNVNKLLTTLGGGMLVSDDADLIAHAHKLAHQARENVAWYQHTEVGFNYRMSNIAAAVGTAQVERLDHLMAGRRAVREAYAEGLADVPGLRVLGRRAGDGQDNCWLTTIVIEGRPFDPDAAIDHLRSRGIEARHLWKPMHQQPVFDGARSYLTGASDRLFAQGLNLPSSSTMDLADVARVVDALRWVMAA